MRPPRGLVKVDREERPSEDAALGKKGKEGPDEVTQRVGSKVMTVSELSDAPSDAMVQWLVMGVDG